MFVNRVFHIWPLALVHADAVITGDGAILLLTAECGDPVIGAITAGGAGSDGMQKIKNRSELIQSITN